MSRSHLLLFARYPRAGEVKTRLVPPLEQTGAERLYRAFLHDLLGRLARLPEISLDVLVAGKSGDADRLRSELAPESESSNTRISFSMQTGADLGERLTNGIDHAFASGADRVVVLGADHPSIPLAILREAFDRLDRADLTIGPSEDGGFHTLGLAGPLPGLLDSLPWSRPELYDRLRRRSLETYELRIHTLPEWYDIDRPEDLTRLIDSESERRDLPETGRVLEELGLISADGAMIVGRGS